MKGYITTENYRASTKISSDKPENLDVLEVSRNSIGAFQLLFYDGNTNQIVLDQPLALPNNLNINTYRVDIESDLQLSAHLIDYYQDDRDIYYADKILEEKRHIYTGDRMAPIYIEIPVDQEIEPNEYKIRLRLFASPLVDSEKCVWERELVVRILEHALPKEISKDFNLNIWQQPSNLARTFGVESWGPEHLRLIKEMAKSLSKLGQKSITVIGSEIPWKGWFSYAVKDYPADLFEYSMIQIHRNKDGNINCDFHYLDQYLDSMMKAGIDQEIDLFGWLGVWKAPFFPDVKDLKYPEPIILRYLDEEQQKFDYLNTKEQLQQYFEQVVKHLKKIGAWSKTYIVADEPKLNSLNAFKESIAELKKVIPDAKFKVTFDKEEALKELAPYVDYLVTSFNCTCQNPELNSKQFYVCNYPDKPNTFLNSNLLETRLLPILAYWTKTDGLLRWAYNCWPENALTDIRYNTNNLPTGDLCLVYPSKSGHLLSSLRMKQLYRGIEDFALLKQAEQRDYEKTQELVVTLLGEKDPKKWMQNSHLTQPALFKQTEKQFKAFRQALLKLIVE
jgi:hypothetical protein